MARYLAMFADDFRRFMANLSDTLYNYFVFFWTCFADIFNLYRTSLGIFLENIGLDKLDVVATAKEVAESKAFSIFVYFVAAFLFVQILRFIFNRIISNRWYKQQINEALSALQVAMFGYGGIAVYRFYGPWAFFFATGIYLTLVQLVTREAIGNFTMAIEELMSTSAGNEDILSSYLIKFFTYSVSFLPAHIIFHLVYSYIEVDVRPSFCTLVDVTTPPIWFPVFEFFSGILLRFAMVYVDGPDRPQRRKWIPWVYALFLTAGQLMLGQHFVHYGMVLSWIFTCAFQMNLIKFFGFWIFFNFCAHLGGWVLAAEFQTGNKMGTFWRQEQFAAEKLARGPPRIEDLARKKGYGKRRD